MKQHESLTGGTCANRIVEVEHEVVRFLEGDAIGFKAFRKSVIVNLAIGINDHENALVFALKKCC